MESCESCGIPGFLISATCLSPRDRGAMTRVPTSMSERSLDRVTSSDFTWGMVSATRYINGIYITDVLVGWDHHDRGLRHARPLSGRAPRLILMWPCLITYSRSERSLDRVSSSDVTINQVSHFNQDGWVHHCLTLFVPWLESRHLVSEGIARVLNHSLYSHL